MVETCHVTSIWTTLNNIAPCNFLNVFFFFHSERPLKPCSQSAFQFVPKVKALWSDEVKSGSSTSDSEKKNISLWPFFCTCQNKNGLFPKCGHKFGRTLLLKILFIVCCNIKIPMRTGLARRDNNKRRKSGVFGRKERLVTAVWKLQYVLWKTESRRQKIVCTD